MLNQSGREKIAAIGDKDVVLVFKALGFDTFFETTPDKIEWVIKKLEMDDYKMILITQTEYKLVESFLEKYNSQPYPVILAIPDGREKEGTSIQKITKNMERAIGSSASLKQG